MRLGISTACFYPQPLEETIDRIASLGFSVIEIFFNTESEYDPSFLDTLKRLTDRNGIEIISIHPYTSLMEGMLLFSNYARRTEDGLTQYRKYMRAAARLGARYLTFHGERFMAQETLFEHMDRTYEVYHTLCDMAHQEGITLTQGANLAIQSICACSPSMSPNCTIRWTSSKPIVPVTIGLLIWM